MIRTRQFNSTWYDFYYFNKATILSFSYERHTKIENFKSKIINIKIEVYYEICELYSYDCIPDAATCTIKDIIIYKTKFIYGEFNKFCNDDDQIIVKLLIQKSKEVMIPFL